MSTGFSPCIVFMSISAPEAMRCFTASNWFQTQAKCKLEYPRERDTQLFFGSEEKRSLPAPLATFNPLVIMFAPRSASIFTDSWWPSIAARSRQVRVWSFRTWRRWCCWMASKRRFSTVFVGIVKRSARFVWLPRVELSKRFSVNWGMLICSIRAARSWALF